MIWRTRNPAHARIAAVCAWAAALAVLLDCAERPKAPERTNPIDPGGVSAGDDPADVRAIFLGSAVNIFWGQIPIEGRAGYRIYRLRRGGDGFDLLGEPVSSALGFRDEEFLRDTLNVYAVAVVNARGEESPIDAFAHDTLDTPPLLVIGTEEAPQDSAATRLLHVTFYSERAESVFLADSAANIDGMQELISPVAYAADPAGYDFLLREGVPSNHMRTVFGRTRRTDGTLSPIASDAVALPALSLAIAVDGESEGPRVTGRKSVAVTLAAAGAESMEVTFDSTFSGVWSAFVPAFEESIPGPGARVLRARVRDGFGGVAQDTFAVVGDTLENVRLVIDGGAAQTRLCTATVEALGGEVLSICLANDPVVFSGDLCRFLTPYDGPIEAWTLAPCANVARVYAVVANDWIPSRRFVTSIDSIYVVGGEATVEFTSPSAGDTVSMSQAVELRGSVTRGNCGGPTWQVLLSARWPAPFDTTQVESLAIGAAQLTPDPLDPARVDWSLPWTPPLDLPAGRLDLIADAYTAPCVTRRSVSIIAAASR